MSTTGPMAPHHRRTVAVVILSTLLVLAVATGSLVAIFYKHLDANLRAGDEIKHQAHKLQRGPKTPLNILVMGLDTRDCPGCHIDNEPGGDGSDTTILLHISADRQTVYGVSIPRDLLVKPTECTADHHYIAHGVDTGQVMWNAAYTAGGPDCTAEQLEKNFGVYVDGYITINFGGFKGMVDAIGGVNMCIPFELSDPTYEKYTFEPGDSVHLNGTTALKYVRLRHVYGHGMDGSDTGRMKRQQAFISAMVNKVRSAGTLTEPYKLVGFANALTGSMTASPELASVSKLVDLARQLRHTDISNIRFVTIPSAAYDVPQSDPRWGRVKLLPAAKKLWRHVTDDEPLSRSLSEGSISAGTPTGGSSASAGPSSSSSPSASPTGTASSDDEAAKEAAKYGLCA
ncbi:LCP family protein [Nocardioides nematodiphilus]|uniref:LCP family protein n=1 Tax=Nocardioides nematodiphilus TaxID=2849669 RepID=UPI001CD9DE1A|nr:LCP family protein [Nocardioides nematodiphilus]MCA1984436.1 LCP family protein [Nocardioides nematodiphilus]